VKIKKKKEEEEKEEKMSENNVLIIINYFYKLKLLILNIKIIICHLLKFPAILYVFADL
jgi:hypothetical protein